MWIKLIVNFQQQTTIEREKKFVAPSYQIDIVRFQRYISVVSESLLNQPKINY